MANIELELVSDINLDQALCALARTLAVGRRTHRAGAWRLKPVQKHLQHARKHLDLLASGSAGEDHLAHAACRLLMALELRERTAAQTRAAGPSSAGAATESDQMPLFAGVARQNVDPPVTLQKNVMVQPDGPARRQLTWRMNNRVAVGRP